MATGLLHLHNLLRWVIIILLLVTIVQAFTKNQGIKKSSLWLLIAAHVTLVIGLYQWATSDKVGYIILKNVGNFGDVMKDSFARFWVVEHLTGTLLAIILITIARGKAKVFNYKAASWLYVIALILILAVVPWPFRHLVGRPWFPGMH
jgi:hypothetical protein